MLDFSAMTFKTMVVHRVGNKLREEGVLLNPKPLSLKDEQLRQVLTDYFLHPFKQEEYYKFTHDAKLELNELYSYCKTIFEDRNLFHETSINIAQHLYNQSTHPKVKNGELYLTYFADCQIEDEMIDVIGIFKSENKDLYLKPEEAERELLLHYEKGINIKKLDKGCLVFKTADEDGYRVLIVDKASKGNPEAQYWKTDFLRLVRVHDDTFDTEAFLQLCQEFSEDVYGDETSKKDQIVFLNKSLTYFNDHENFALEEFANEVLEEPQKIGNFNNFKQTFEEDRGYVATPDFKISQPAVKNMKRRFKRNIELDSDINIRLNSDVSEQYIERGYDEERGMFFYKVFFREEV